jgi:hypothetical protein
MVDDIINLSEYAPKPSLLTLFPERTSKYFDTGKKLSIPEVDLIPKCPSERMKDANEWGKMPATEMTSETRRDLQLIRLRNVLDPKRFYKKDKEILKSDSFQIGTVINSAVDHYNRLSKKERKKHVIDDLLADAESVQYYKKKFLEIQEKKGRKSKSGYKKIKSNRQLKPKFG